MSRPTADIIDSIEQGNYHLHVAAADCLWQVLRYNQPIYLIKQHWLQDRKTYPKTSFSSAAHAQRLADKLNGIYNTQAYTIRKV
jgi:hypothetical protein